MGVVISSAQVVPTDRRLITHSKRATRQSLLALVHYRMTVQYGISRFPDYSNFAGCMISCYLQSVINQHCKSDEKDLIIGESSKITTLFDSNLGYMFTITVYLNMIITQKQLSVSTCIHAIVYLDRLMSGALEPFIHVNQRTVHRVLALVLFLAFKFDSDEEVVLASTWESVTGIPKQDILKLEQVMFACLNYNLYVEPEVYYLACSNILQPAMHLECVKSSSHYCKYRYLLAHGLLRFKNHIDVFFGDYAHLLLDDDDDV